MNRNYYSHKICKSLKLGIRIFLVLAIALLLLFVCFLASTGCSRKKQTTEATYCATMNEIECYYYFFN